MPAPPLLAYRPFRKGLDGLVPGPTDTEYNGDYILRAKSGWVPVGGGIITSLTVSAPLTVTPGPTPNIALPQAGATSSGYLSATDWIKFNTSANVFVMGSVNQYLRGDKTWQILNKAAVGLGNVLNVAQEPALGNPGGNGWVLSSTMAGVRSWIAAGGGTVTSVAAGTGLTATPSPIIGAGTLAVAGALSTLYSLADAAGWLHSTGANVFAWSTPTAANVGAIATSLMTTLGDIIFENATPVPDRLAGNITATRMFLRQLGTGAISAAPAWDTLQASDIPALSYLAAVTSDSPLTGSGTAGSHLTFSAQTAAYVFAGPATGGAVVPTFRALVTTDIPALSYQAPYANLTTIGALANGTGWLHDNGAGVFAYSTPTYTDVGADIAGAAAARQAAYTILTTLGTLGNTGGAGWLHNDGSGVLAWTTPPAGTGTVTSVTAGTGLTATTNPITVSGTISVTGPLLTLTNLADAAGWLHSTGANVFAWSTPTAADVGALAAVTSDSPLTGAGTGGSHLTFSAQTAAYVFAGPATGGAVVPAFRALVATDIPALSYQAPYTILTTLGVLNNTGGAGWLHNDGSGVLAWSTPSLITHNLLSASHPDTVAGSPVLGDLIFGNASPYWDKLAGNITTTRKFLRQTGTSLISAAPAWDTVTSTDVGLSAVTNDAQTKASIVPNTAPNAGQILVGNAGNTAYAPQTMGTDATLASTGALTIANGAVTLAKMANMATASLFYRKTAGNGAPEVNTLATLKTDLGLTGTNSGDQTITLTGNVTGSGTGSFATTIAANAVTLAMMAAIANNTVLGNISGGAAVPSALTGANVRTICGLATSDSPQFAGLRVGGTDNYSVLNVIGIEGTILGNGLVTFEDSSHYAVQVGYDRTADRGWIKAGLIATAGKVLDVNGGVYVGYGTATLDVGRIIGDSSSISLSRAAGAPSVNVCRCNNTIASPTAISGDQVIGQLGFRAHDGTNWSGNQGQLTFKANGTWTGSNHGTYLQIQTTPNGSTTLGEIARFTASGNLLIGTTSETGLTGAGGLVLASTTEATTYAAASLILPGGLGVARKIITNSDITTGAPAGGTAAAWKLGIWVNTPTVPTGYIQVDIGGTLYEIPAKVH